MSGGKPIPGPRQSQCEIVCTWTGKNPCVMLVESDISRQPPYQCSRPIHQLVLADRPAPSHRQSFSGCDNVMGICGSGQMLMQIHPMSYGTAWGRDTSRGPTCRPRRWSRSLKVLFPRTMAGKNATIENSGSTCEKIRRVRLVNLLKHFSTACLKYGARLNCHWGIEMVTLPTAAALIPGPAV